MEYPSKGFKYVILFIMGIVLPYLIGFYIVREKGHLLFEYWMVGFSFVYFMSFVTTIGYWIFRPIPKQKLEL